MRKQEEIERTVKALQSAVEYADKLDGGVIQNGAQGNANHNSGTNAGAHNGSLKRQPRPLIPVRPSITEYSRNELVRLIQWISSDGELRTDDEIITEMVAALGFGRRGVRIEAAIRNALVAFRAASQH